MAYNTGITASNLEFNEIYGLVEKIARQVIRNVTADDRLAELEKGEIENGTVLEQVIVALAEAGVFTDTYDGTDATDPFKALDPELVVRYFKDWTTRQYSAKVSNQKLRKVISNGGSAGQIAEMIVASLVEGENQTNYETVKGMFADSTVRANAIVDAVTVEDATDYKGILVALKNTISGMSFVNTTYNKAGIKRKTNKEDIRILMPYTLKNAIDVEELSGVFNLSKAEVESRIIEIDSADSDIFVFDQNAIQIYTRLKELTSEFNAKTLEMNYFYTVDKLYAISPLFDVARIHVGA